MMDKEVVNLSNKFLDFSWNSPSPFHAVAVCKERLESHGYLKLSEKQEEWHLEPNKKYYFTRNQSTICAFAVGGRFKPGNGCNIIGAHTDSPVLKLKPISNISRSGYVLVGVQPYGGGLWHTWFDRDLSIAGRVVVRVSENKFDHRLVRINNPILRIPTLAIHLDSSVNEAFKFNTETHLVPVIATTVKSVLEKKDDKHSTTLMTLLANELKCEVSNICDFELCLYDTQKPALGGALNEFIFSARLDNLMSSFSALEALLGTEETLAQDSRIRMICLFDNEEVGSASAYGADSDLIETVLSRLHVNVASSFLVSADMAHAVHPNYSSVHEDSHRPALHKGPVLKYNANQKYATTATTAFIIKEVANRKKIPLQEYVVRNDGRCGSTIGNILAPKAGIRTVDLGQPQLSMHSIREMAAVDDTYYSVQLFKGFFNEVTEIDKNLPIDD